MSETISIDELRHVLAASGELARGGTEEETVALVAAAAVVAVPGADFAGMVRATSGGQLETAFSSQQSLAGELDDLQVRLLDGPCVDAIRETSRVHAPRLGGDDRWPRFAARAVELGVHACLSIRLSIGDEAVGALNLYSRAADAFGPSAGTLAELYGTHAAIALAGASRVAELERALANRDVIGQAKGILMQRFAISADTAFEALVHVSQHSNKKLVTVARLLAASVPSGRSARPSVLNDSHAT